MKNHSMEQTVNVTEIISKKGIIMNVKGVQTGAELVITINFDNVNQSEIFNRLFVECLQKMADEDGSQLMDIKGDRVKNLRQTEISESTSKLSEKFNNWI